MALLFLIALFGLILVPSLTCAPEPAETPATPPAPTTTPTPEPPALSSPANESTTQDLQVRLEWNTSADADSYALQVATDPNFANFVINETGIADTCYEVISGLNWKSDYYWRINASNASGTSSWSGSWQFSTPVFKLGKIAFN